MALVIGPSAAKAWGAPPRPRVAVVGDGLRRVVDMEQAAPLVAEVEASGVRWVWWAAEAVAPLLSAAGNRPARAWDIAEAHRLLAGGWQADPGSAWALGHGLDVGGVPPLPRDDLLGIAGAQTAEAVTWPVRPDGHLLPEAAAGTWQTNDERLLAWAQVTLDCAAAQETWAAHITPRLLATIRSESAAAVVCTELEHDGLPVDRRTLMSVIDPLSAPKATVDAAVLELVPGNEHTDLRNPAHVRSMLRSVGIEVPDTRKWTLMDYQDVHPVVPALLAWRAAERIRTTFGLRWIEEHVGSDDRLRGRWHTCDGGAGRMTAEGGLHSIPAVLRPGVAAHPGHVLVRADLGQVEPRVLAAVTGDTGMAAATLADDLYLGLGQQLGVERARAKIAMLAAMYGQRGGSAGPALAALERAYPTAMRVLDEAEAAGVAGGDVRTFGGRRIPTAHLVPGPEAGGPGDVNAAGRGRFARNAIVQGAAAELFKAWTATVRATTARWDAQIVMCLHDELLIHVPEEHGTAVASAVDQALDDAARRWSGGAPVRFVSDTQVIRRWSEAKD